MASNTTQPTPSTQPIRSIQQRSRSTTPMPELLSPAGDLEKLRFAIAYGADAVYLAGQQFGMRAAAANFSREDLIHGIHYAHERGVSCYVTVNIMPSNRDLLALPEYLTFLQDAGADALIVADVGVIRLAQQYAPRVPLHISTQTSILNYEAANFWADWGASRVVLARELSLDEIAEIRAKTPPSLELEAFVHGAMCISYSGRCLISQYLTGRDANHGACAQPCRWKYALMEEKRPGEYFPIEEADGGTYLYNSKDLCMIAHIPALLQAGVTSLKIEGRNKTAYYAACVTNAYRQAIDAYSRDSRGEQAAGPYKDAAARSATDATVDSIADSTVDSLADSAADSMLNPMLDPIANSIAEVEKVSHRVYYTGFYFGKEENGQHYSDSQYIRSYEVIGMPIGPEDDGRFVFALKNRFFQGDELELIQPHQPAYVFRALDVTDDEGNALPLFNVPQMRLHFRFPFAIDAFSILRKKKVTEPSTEQEPNPTSSPSG